MNRLKFGIGGGAAAVAALSFPQGARAQSTLYRTFKYLLVMGFNSIGGQRTLGALEQDFGFELDGTGCYYGINKQTITPMLGPDSTTLKNKIHGAFFRDFIKWLLACKFNDKALVIGIEPSEYQSYLKYRYVTQNADFVGQFATDLAGLQQVANDHGKSLTIYIRYDSEMNAAGNYQVHQDEYINSFNAVRAIFKKLAPAVKFSFSPAISSVSTESSIERYWPGDDAVDIIGATWYVHAQRQWALAKSNMITYTSHFAKKSKAFGICEFGVKPPISTDVDQWLQTMLGALVESNPDSTYEYATIFLQAKNDATLDFLKAEMLSRRGSP